MLNDSINRFLGIICYPFTSLDYLKEDLLDIYFKVDKKDHDKIEYIREKIKGDVIQYIRQNYTIYSYDEIYLYLEKCYLYSFDKYNDSFECYYDIFSSLSKSLISQRNGKLVFKYWENENDKKLLGGFAQNNKVFLFHSINRHIPLDIISIIYLLQNNVTDTAYLHNFYGQIVVSDLQLDNVLEKGVAENHLHSGVSRSFLSIWESLLEPFTAKSINDFKSLNLSNNYNYGSNELIFYILSSGILRVYISIKIKEDSNCNGGNYSDDELYKDLLNAFINLEDIKELYQKIYREQDEDEIYSYFIDKWNTLLTHNNIDYKYGQNIIFNIFKQSAELKTSGENIFLFNTLKYIKTNYSSCDCIKKLFIQYIRIKNCIFNIMVQQKTIKGLDYFQIQHYRKNSKMNKVNNKNFWEYAMREQFQDENLRKVEFRRSIDKKFTAFRKDIVCFLKSYYNILKNDYCIKEGDKYIPYKIFPQVGLVYHLLKRDDETSPYKCFVDGESDDEKLQFKMIQNEYEVLIDNLKSLRNENSELSKYIVGLDAASLESSTPVWVFSKVYEMARDSSEEPLLTKNNTLDCFQSIGFTFHAGEDYRHVLSGLRRIDEAVEHLKFHAGDRIGHGSVLGISIERWKARNHTIIIPRIEALENYLWAYNILSQNYGDLKASIIAYLEKKIYDLSESIYQHTEGLTTPVLIDGYLKLFKYSYDDCKNDLESFCESVKYNNPTPWNSRKLFIARHCKYYLSKMKEPIHFEITDQDIDITKELQKIVKLNISKAGIVVEINPSSNIVIGDMDILSDSHVYNINNFMYDTNNVLVCINSDDPTVFNTNVSNELAYTYYGLLGANVSKENALMWIEKLRVNGIDSSFIKRKESDEQILRKLECLISDL